MMIDGISIIIPTYNRPNVLRKTLCGLIAQKGYAGQYEIVIVDNGSEEGLLMKISDFKDDLSIVFLRRKLRRNHFKPGSARNIGVSRAKYNLLVFLDSDCVPSENLLYYHSMILKSEQGSVTLGHRVFVDESVLTERMILSGKYMHSELKLVKSPSNYLQDSDRRIPELTMLSNHPAPYNCLHGCNVGLRKEEFLRAGRFDESFDGHWGYEDIELGHRLFLHGARFAYLPDAFVYHLEGEGLSLSDRLEGRRRNYALACKKIPNFDSFRKSIGR
jgi:glycosyltransferase involved in cell wall biosynthesis